MENKKDVFDRGKEIGVQPPSDTHSNDNTILEQLQDAENSLKIIIVLNKIYRN